MSRISYTMTNPEGLEHLNKAILDGLSGIAEEAAEAAKVLDKEQIRLEFTEKVLVA